MIVAGIGPFTIQKIRVRKDWLYQRREQRKETVVRHYLSIISHELGILKGNFEEYIEMNYKEAKSKFVKDFFRLKNIKFKKKILRSEIDKTVIKMRTLS